MLQKSGILFLLFFSFSSFAQKVYHSGAMRNVMMGISLDNHIQWDTIGQKHLFGIGPLAGLTGEVTVVDDKIYLSQVDASGKMHVYQAETAAGPFGVYANASTFSSIPLQVSIKGLEALERLISDQVEAQGRALDDPFLFRIQGTFAEVYSRKSGLRVGQPKAAPLSSGLQTVGLQTTFSLV